jgi:hypothetical protein
MDLKSAVQMITDDYPVPDGQSADPTEVVWEVRGSQTPQELDSWTDTDPELVVAYRHVLIATNNEITAVLAEITQAPA